MNIKLQLPKMSSLRPRITVVGVGGAGSNAVNNMIAAGLSGVNFVVANTDSQSLANSTAEHRIQLGAALTEGLGAGARPEIGKAAAEEAHEEIRAQVAGSHMVFVAGGMGGGTGTGAAAVIARIARECGALTVGVVTKPFQFEGTRRMRAAEIGISALKPEVDTLLVIPNQNLFRIANERTTFADAFVLADQVLYSGIACVVDLIVKDGLINLDFADVRTVMSGMGTAMMGTGEAAGDRRAVIAAEEAISNPLLDDISLRGARGLLISITGNRDLTLYEVDEAATRVRQEVDPEAVVIVGATFDDTIGDRIRVSIVASGMERVSDNGSSDWQAMHAARTATVMPSQSAPVANDIGRNDFSRPEAATYPQDQLSSLSQPTPLHHDPQIIHGAGGQTGSPRQDRTAARQAADQANLTRVISEALGTRAADAESQFASNPGWESRSGAVFTEGPPQLSPSTDRGAAYPSAQPPYEEHDFAPQAPAEIQRSQRRLPQVEDFPLVGQRDYHAKAGHYPEPASQPAPRAYTQTQPAAEPTRKLGFFERLTGARRKASAKSPNTAVHPQAPEIHETYRGSAGNVPRSNEQDPARAAPQHAIDPHDLPVFFGGGRK